MLIVLNESLIGFVVETRMSAVLNIEVGLSGHFHTNIINFAETTKFYISKLKHFSADSVNPSV